MSMVKNLLIRESIFKRGEAYQVVQAVVRFRDDMVVHGYFDEPELPEEVLTTIACYYYDGDVRNGGHEQFVSNSGWKSAQLDYISLGLGRCGAAEYLELFGEFRSQLDGDRDALLSANRRGGFDDLNSDPPSKFLNDIDSRFFAQSKVKGISDFLAEWIRQLPTLEIAPDDQWRSTMGSMTLDNPHRADRILLSQRPERSFQVNDIPIDEDEEVALGDATRLCRLAGVALVQLKSAGWATQYGFDMLADALSPDDHYIFEEGALMGILDTDNGSLFSYSSSKGAVLVYSKEKKILSRFVK